MHRLRTERRKVDDRESAVRETDASLCIVPNTLSVRSAMRYRLRHMMQVGRGIVGTQRLVLEKSCYPAH